MNIITRLGGKRDREECKAKRKGRSRRKKKTRKNHTQGKRNETKWKKKWVRSERSPKKWQNGREGGGEEKRKRRRKREEMVFLSPKPLLFLSLTKPARARLRVLDGFLPPSCRYEYFFFLIFLLLLPIFFFFSLSPSFPGWYLANFLF